MQDVITELKNNTFFITLNRTEKCNAFDDHLLLHLQTILEKAEANPEVHVIVLQANGPHFCSGADLAWMQRMVDMNESENLKDAKILARLMYTLDQISKPTVALVRGAAYGGGIGLLAATDIVIASDQAKFCFSEVKLGLIPAVISPYVVRAIGQRAALWLFMTAQVFNAEKARELHLVHEVIPDEIFSSASHRLITQLSQLPPEGVKLSKSLVRHVAENPIDEALIHYTAAQIAEKRISKEAQYHIRAFLNKREN